MKTGNVVGIYISPQRGQLTQAVEQIHVVPGKGINGDRYFRETEKGEKHSKPGQEITLIEIEAIEALSDEGIPITPIPHQHPILFGSQEDSTIWQLRQ